MAQRGKGRGYRATSSWIAPSGQTAAQKIRPNNRAASSGSAKKQSTDAGTATPGLNSPSATFWNEPTEHTQPWRTNPK